MVVRNTSLPETSGGDQPGRTSERKTTMSEKDNQLELARLALTLVRVKLKMDGKLSLRELQVLL